MNLTSTDYAAILTVLVMILIMGCLDDPRALNWLKAQWARTLGAWCARRRRLKILDRRGWKHFKV
jgi:hypothetical protein